MDTQKQNQQINALAAKQGATEDYLGTTIGDLLDARATITLLQQQLREQVGKAAETEQLREQLDRLKSEPKADPEELERAKERANRYLEEANAEREERQAVEKVLREKTDTIYDLQLSLETVIGDRNKACSDREKLEEQTKRLQAENEKLKAAAKPKPKKAAAKKPAKKAAKKTAKK